MSLCSQCGAPLTCAMADAAGQHPCWCTTLPAVASVPDVTDASCWCPACLRARVDALATLPAPTRDQPD